MSKLDKDQVINEFTEAYKAANGKAPTIEAKGGWYSVDGGKNMRLAAIQEMTDELKGGASNSKPAPKASAKADSKPAKAKAAPKKSKAAKPKSSGFSVKQFWAEQILEKNSGSKLPR